MFRSYKRTVVLDTSGGGRAINRNRESEAIDFKARKLIKKILTKALGYTPFEK